MLKNLWSRKFVPKLFETEGKSDSSKEGLVSVCSEASKSLSLPWNGSPCLPDKGTTKSDKAFVVSTRRNFCSKGPERESKNSLSKRNYPSLQSKTSFHWPFEYFLFVPKLKRNEWNEVQSQTKYIFFRDVPSLQMSCNKKAVGKNMSSSTSFSSLKNSPFLPLKAFFWVVFQDKENQSVTF